MFERRIPQCLLALCLAAPLAHAEVKIPDRLQNASKVTFCGGMDSPPMGFYDANQKLTGVTIDLGEASPSAWATRRSTGASRPSPG